VSITSFAALLTAMALTSASGAVGDGVGGLGGPIANTNPGFERVEGESIAGWENTPRWDTRWTRVETGAHDGTACMALKGPAKEDDFWVFLRSEPIPVHPGDVVDYDLWIRCDGTPRVPLKAFVMALVDGEWRAVQHGAYARGPLPHWTYLWRSGEIVPAGAEAIQLAAYASSREPANVTWYIDDFRCRVTSLAQYVEGRKDAERLKDIIVIVPDALRRSVLGCYGSATNETLNIDRLAQEGRLYTQATTACPWTKPSFASLWTSRFPSQHTAEDIGWKLPQDLTTLAEALKARGYFTAGFAFSSVDGYLGSQMGYAQGFDVYLQTRTEEHVTEGLLDFLDANAPWIRHMKGGGLFLFVHVFTPHEPYENKTPNLLRNAGLLGTVDINSKDFMTPIRKGEWRFGEDYNQDDIAYIRSLYDWEVVRTDQYVGEVMARMRWLGLHDTVNVVFTADHGEAFDENGEWGHGHGFETCTGIPLILRFPGITEPTVDRDTLASNLDIMPTILGLATAASPEGMEGRNLLDAHADGITAHLGICEDRRHGWLTLRNERDKLVMSGASLSEGGPRWSIMAPDGTPVYRLFDLSADPAELNDLSAIEPARFEALKALLVSHCGRVGIIGDSASAATHIEGHVSDDTRRQLEALGYLD